MPHLNVEVQTADAHPLLFVLGRNHWGPDAVGLDVLEGSLDILPRHNPVQLTKHLLNHPPRTSKEKTNLLRCHHG